MMRGAGPGGRGWKIEEEELEEEEEGCVEGLGSKGNCHQEGEQDLGARRQQKWYWGG